MMTHENKRMHLEEYETIVNVCAPNNRNSKYMQEKRTALKGETDKSVHGLRDFNAFSQILIKLLNKISKGREEPNNTLTP